MLAALLYLFTPSAGGAPPAPPASPAVVLPLQTPPQVPSPPPSPPAPPTASVQNDAVSPPGVGGYAVMDPRAPELRPVLQAALAHILPARRGRGKIVSAQRQVVAGMNYRLDLKLRDASRWRVTVWRRLDGTLQVTSAERHD